MLYTDGENAGKQEGKEKTKGMMEMRQEPGDMFAMSFQLLEGE
jgi:hypothetical protein